MSDKNRSRKLWSVLLAALLVLPGGVLAQTAEKAPSKTFSQEQLDQLLAPVALYPDDLLTQLLMASTYPLEVAKANSWVKQNKELKGDAITKALEKQEWDPSVKSLVNFPQVLQMMDRQAGLDAETRGRLPRAAEGCHGHRSEAPQESV